MPPDVLGKRAKEHFPRWSARGRRVSKYCRRVDQPRPFLIAPFRAAALAVDSGKDGVVQVRHRNKWTAAIAIAALTALAVFTIVRPRLAQLRTATTGTGGATLLVVGAVICVAALTPVAALTRVQTWKPVAVSVTALVLGSALVLSFDERSGSDGLFMFPLLIGSVITLSLSGLATLRLRRAEPARTFIAIMIPMRNTTHTS